MSLPRKKKVPKGKPRKGFSRSQKDWEKSIAGHIGKFIDRMTVKDVEELFLNVGLAIVGVEVFKGWKGALYGPIALRLARTDGGSPPIAQIAGVAGLLTLGLPFIVPTVTAAAEYVVDPKQGVIPAATGKKGPLYWNWAKGEWATVPEEEWGLTPY